MKRSIKVFLILVYSLLLGCNPNNEIVFSTTDGKCKGIYFNISDSYISRDGNIIKYKCVINNCSVSDIYIENNFNRTITTHTKSHLYIIDCYQIDDIFLSADYLPVPVIKIPSKQKAVFSISHDFTNYKDLSKLINQHKGMSEDDQNTIKNYTSIQINLRCFFVNDITYVNNFEDYTNLAKKAIILHSNIAYNRE